MQIDRMIERLGQLKVQQHLGWRIDRQRISDSIYDLETRLIDAIDNGETTAEQTQQITTLFA